MIKTLFTLWLFLSISFVFGNQLLINLPADSWYTVKNSKMRVVCDPNVNSYECESVQSAWSGGAYDPIEHQMIIWGGGHQDSHDNSVYTFDIETLKWKRLMSNTGSYADKDPLSNGDPAARHTYDGLAYVGHAKRLFAYGGSRAGSGSGTELTWTANLQTKSWSNMRPKGSNGPTTACCNFTSEYDPISKKVYMRDPNYLYAYDYDNNSWNVVLEESHNWDAHKGVVDTKRHLLFNIGSGKFLVYDIAGKKNAKNQWNTSGGGSVIGSKYAAAAYDSKADKIVAWVGGGPYVLDLDKKSWSRKASSGAPGSGLGNGTFGRWRYIPEYNVFILINGVDSDVYFYKHSAGNGSQYNYTTVIDPKKKVKITSNYSSIFLPDYSNMLMKNRDGLLYTIKGIKENISENTIILDQRIPHEQ